VIADHDWETAIDPLRKVESAISDQPKAVRAALSAKGLSLIPLNNHENDLTFSIGEREYVCLLLIAEFLSPRLCELRRSDSTIHDFHITTNRNNQPSFHEIIEILKEDDFRIAEEVNSEAVSAFLSSVESPELWPKRDISGIHCISAWRLRTRWIIGSSITQILNDSN
jgi:hypothetical protein